MNLRLLIFSIIIILFSTSTIFSQLLTNDYFTKNLEVYFSFHIQDKSELSNLTRIISIDNVIDNTVFAYANEDEYNSFWQLNYDYTILPHPGDVDFVAMANTIDDIKEWDYYPTYDGYLDLMNQFAVDYPNLCTIVDAGNSVLNRKILFAKISDNVNEQESEPQFMYTSTMHGDETTGYVLMLRLIDYLLSNYGTDLKVTNLVDNIEIWINPLANPDGTYYSGNHTVNGARRNNANGYNLNRNFPDPEEGPFPNGPRQPETSVFMQAAEENNFIFSANFHGGTEVVNYPWDTWARLHADDDWFQLISHQYADTVHLNSPSSYMTGYNNGITNGYQWYRITGGRQDYMTYFRHGRETTIEISDTKLLPASQLNAHWDYNKSSLLNYIEQSLYGIEGIVTDTLGNPLRAKIIVESHDMDSSHVYSDSINGYYHRLINAGTYTLSFLVDGYFPETISNISVENNSVTPLNVQLVPDEIPVELTSFTAEQTRNNVVLKWSTATEINNYGFEIERNTPLASGVPPSSGDETGGWDKIGFVEGKGTTTEISNYQFADENVINGNYLYRLMQIDFDGSYTYSNKIELNVELFQEFVLEQNYPNPFNPTTTINYSIPKLSFVSLKVFDIVGNELSTLVSKEKPSGNYEIKFDASELPSGVYFYRLQVYPAEGGVDSFADTKKFILLK